MNKKNTCIKTEKGLSSRHVEEILKHADMYIDQLQ